MINVTLTYRQIFRNYYIQNLRSKCIPNRIKGNIKIVSAYLSSLTECLFECLNNIIIYRDSNSNNSFGHPSAKFL